MFGPIKLAGCPRSEKGISGRLVLLPILLRKTHQRRGITYDVIDELRHLSLSKCFPVLCHKLIYEIVIFHSINRETCDKYNYVSLCCSGGKDSCYNMMQCVAEGHDIVALANLKPDKQGTTKQFMYQLGVNSI